MDDERMGGRDASSKDSSPDAGLRATRPDAWRRGIRDPENWHDLAERGTPRNG